MIVFSLLPGRYLNFISPRTAMIQLGHSAWSFSLVIQPGHLRFLAFHAGILYVSLQFPF